MYAGWLIVCAEKINGGEGGTLSQFTDSKALFATH